MEQEKKNKKDHLNLVGVAPAPLVGSAAGSASKQRGWNRSSGSSFS
jgi:hypothetical protein